MKYSLLTICAVVFIFPDLAQAQPQSLVPTDLCDGPTCSACHIVELVNRLIKWLIGAVILLFAVLAVWAGFGLVTSGGNTSALSDAKSRFTNAFIGFLIVLAAWLIVDTLMRGIVSGVDGTIENYGPWSQVQCFTQSAVDTVPGRLEITIEEIIEEETALIDAGLASADVLSSVDASASNCGVDDSALVSIPGQGGHRAVAGVVERYINMRDAAAARGFNLSINSSYRSDARQAELWDGCTRCQTQGTIARPCSRGGGGSRHSSGVALDISSSGGTGERCEVVSLCRSAGASFIMLYEGSGHVHCDWGSRSGEVNVSC